MLKPMDPDTIRQMLDGEEDILTPAAKAEDAHYRATRCPVCNEGGCIKVISEIRVELNELGETEIIQSPFSSLEPLPQGYARCIHCDTEFNPYTGMIYQTAASMIHGSD